MGGLMAQGSLAWKHPSYPPTKTLKAAPSVRNIMVTVFWNDKGVLLVDFLDRIDNVTVKRYCSQLRGLGRIFVPEGLGCCAKLPSSCTTTQGPTVPAGLATGYGWKATLPTVPISRTAISVSLDRLRST